MRKLAARRGLVGAVLMVGWALAGCSGTGATGTHAPASAAATSAGSAPTAHPAGSSDPRKKMPALTPARVVDIGFGAASSTDVHQFAHVSGASAGLLVSSSVRNLTVAGRDVGAVAVFGLKPGAAKSSMFQDQYVAQLLNAVAGSKASPRFVRIPGQVVALTAGPTAVAGWVNDGKVVLVYREGKTPDLAALAAGVRSMPVVG